MSSSIAPEPQAADLEGRPPLVVDLDGTLLRSDLLHETFAAAFFSHPLLTLWVVLRTLLAGPAAVKRALCELVPLDVATLPLREPLLAYLMAQKRRGRTLHLATAADSDLAQAVAARVGLFDRVYASDGRHNLKGLAKAQVLAAEFPAGFSYAGDCRADLAVWRLAATAVVVAPRGLAREVTGLTELEHHVDAPHAGLAPWLKAARPHQWAKNLLVLVPTILGWPVVTGGGLVRTLITLGLLCAISSLTYIVNDVADVQSDRRHARKHRRPFAAGVLPLRDGLIAGAVGIPAVLGLAWLLVGPATTGCLIAYCVLTLAYSMGLKRVPLADCLTIGILFTIRISAGIAAGALYWSPWLLTFSLTLFFSLAMAKRHTELVAGGPGASGPIPGRGYGYEDHGFVLALGCAASTLSILIIVLYLMDEVFPLGAYHAPVALWATPPLLFLWIGRIWLLANRGEMHDDPVAFALKDRVSWLLAAAVGAAFLVAVV